MAAQGMAYGVGQGIGQNMPIAVPSQPDRRQTFQEMANVAASALMRCHHLIDALEGKGEKDRDTGPTVGLNGALLGVAEMAMKMEERLNELKARVGTL